MKLYTHLNFGGNCEEAFLFYAEHLGGKVTIMMKAEDAVIHARMSIADVELIGNDVPKDRF